MKHLPSVKQDKKAKAFVLSSGKWRSYIDYILRCKKRNCVSKYLFSPNFNNICFQIILKKEKPTVILLPPKSFFEFSLFSPYSTQEQIL